MFISNNCSLLLKASKNRFNGTSMYLIVLKTVLLNQKFGNTVQRRAKRFFSCFVCALDVFHSATSSCYKSTTIDVCFLFSFFGLYPFNRIQKKFVLSTSLRGKNLHSIGTQFRVCVLLDSRDKSFHMLKFCRNDQK